MAVEFETLQEAAQELAEDTEKHDRAGLAALSDGHLREQSDAREELADYLETLWENIKKTGANPAIDPRFEGLSGLLDLARHLHETAADVLEQREN
ncbi:hypothetical protein [Kitasatospora sp. NPDC089509]|uniref:hypothetical protein n=1 Tax=Kitasatospora sp. NPDC089509 TaxID=3364079 RepID=UPI00382E26E8